ncbi:hypothetical protein ACFX13_038281 [Malus domestica]|uniref:late embryogenesis abundant protein 18 n=1 Tax=Malus domestica TaxID=3750 RepID=UPI0021AC4E07|nr:late embryogenesis abundant protein 6 [Malus sylvestris]
MQSAKEKLSNMASAAKEHVDIYKAKAQEKVVKATAKTDEEREIASQIRRAKEAKAKMEFHEAKTKHSAEKSTASAENKSHLLHGQDDQPVARVGDGHGNDHQPHDAGPLPKTTVPAYPLGGYRTHKFPLK